MTYVHAVDNLLWNRSHVVGRSEDEGRRERSVVVVVAFSWWGRRLTSAKRVLSLGWGLGRAVQRRVKNGLLTDVAITYRPRAKRRALVSLSAAGRGAAETREAAKSAKATLLMESMLLKLGVL